MRTRNPAVDLVKFIASLLVVAIHTSLFSDVSETLYFVTVQIICRLAVPFFAVCTGYFLGKRYDFGEQGSSGNRMMFLRQWKKLILLYAVWSVVYLFVSIPHWIRIGWFSSWAFVDYAIAACTKGAYYHLWYLWGMIVSYPILYAVLRWIRKKHWLWMICALWVFKIVGYTYGTFLPEGLSGLVSALGRMDTLLCVVPLALLGVWMSQEPEKNRRYYQTGFAISFALLVAEAFVLKAAGASAFSYIVFTLPAAYFLFGMILRIQLKDAGGICSKLAQTSMFIYCVHAGVVVILADYLKSSIMHFVLTAALSVSLGFLYLRFRKK